MTERVIAPTPALVARLAAEVKSAADTAIAARGIFTIALSGGSLATTYFPAFVPLDIPWARTTFFWADERAVAPSDPESNYAVAKHLWLEPARVPTNRVYRMVAEAPDPVIAASAYEEALRRAAGSPPVLDLVLLGMGPDGHVASLFPGHALLGETRRSVAVVEDSPKPPPRRMTLTLPVLTAARLVVVAASGAAKAAIVRDALDTPDSMLPVARVLREAEQALVLLDPEAGSQLAGPIN